MRTLSTNPRRAGVVLAMVPVIVNAAPAATAIRRRDDDDDDDDEDDDNDDDDDDDDDKKDRKEKFTSIDLGFSFTTIEEAKPIEPTSAPPPRQTRPPIEEGPQFGSVKPSPEVTTSSPSARPTTGPQFGAVPGEDDNERERETTSSRRRTTTATTTSTEPETTEPSNTSPGINTALPGETNGANASPTPQVGESADHIRMEIGIGLGVLGFFLILSVAIFLWLKRRRRGNGSMWGAVKSIGRSRRNEDRGPIEPNMSQTYESRAIGDRNEWPAVPDAAILSYGDVKRLSESMSDESFTSLRRKYTISRSVDIPVAKPSPPPPRGRTSSTSSYVTMTVAGHLPHISSSGFDDSFLENIDEHPNHTFRDPFADPYSPTTSSMPPAPPPLRFPVKPIAPIQTGRVRAMHKYNASDETLELTDPRILSPGGRLVITNRSREDSVPSLPPSPPRKRGMIRNSGHVIPLPLRVNRDQPPRFPWNNRESGLSVNSEAPARHRGVKSWVNHEVEIRERYPSIEEVDSPRYAQSEATLYNRFSINSGMDTRRTEYEYYSR
ncbi:hypothetical protein EYR41_009466 [Orbilia oligospora]|uniref:Mid2 domain-containing protein n=1 Tax=Orbilia oligospora TaxID=2813651 RepID=A0A8H2DV35_ORBOL|nr:hypothetical protein EYR41_009466 [Orbilia oligospora]